MYQTIQIKVLGIIHCYKYISYGHECAPAKRNSHVIIMYLLHSMHSVGKSSKIVSFEFFRKICTNVMKIQISLLRNKGSSLRSQCCKMRLFSDFQTDNNVTNPKSSGKLYALYLPWNSIHTSRYTVPIKKAEVSTVVVRK